MRAPLPPLLVVSLVLACSKANDSTEKAPEAKADAESKAAPGTAARSEEEGKALESLARRAAASGKRIGMAEQDGLHGRVRRVVESSSGVELNTYLYDCNGYPLQVGTAKFEWTFDDAGCPVRAETALGPIVAECDQSGRVILAKTLDPTSEQPVEHEHSEYDADGRVLWRRKFGPAGEVLATIENEYDDHGDPVIEKLDSPRRSRVRTTEYEHRDDGSKVAVVTEEPGDGKRRSTYGAHGLVELEETLDASGKVTAATTHRYVLDEHGNWTQHDEREQDEDEPSVLTRTIEYCD